MGRVKPFELWQMQVNVANLPVQDGVHVGKLWKDFLSCLVKSFHCWGFTRVFALACIDHREFLVNFEEGVTQHVFSFSSAANQNSAGTQSA